MRLQKVLALPLLAASAVAAPLLAAVTDEWARLVTWDIALVDLNVSSIERGPHGGIQAYVLTIYTKAQTTLDGTEYRNSTQVLEFDCEGQKSWLHAVGYEMDSKIVAIRKYPGADSYRFMPPETLGGGVEKAACEYFRKKGLV